MITLLIIISSVIHANNGAKARSCQRASRPWPRLSFAVKTFATSLVRAREPGKFFLPCSSATHESTIGVISLSALAPDMTLRPYYWIPCCANRLWFPTRLGKPHPPSSPCRLDTVQHILGAKARPMPPRVPLIRYAVSGIPFPPGPPPSTNSLRPGKAATSPVYHTRNTAGESDIPTRF